MFLTLDNDRLPPGFARSGTVYQTKGRWYDGNGVRFFQGQRGPIGGWASSGQTVTGTPRSMLTWKLNTGSVATAVGTHSKLYVFVAGTRYDITPAGFAANASTVWQLDNFGGYLVAAPFINGSNAPLVYFWAGNTGVAAALINVNATTNVNSVVVTPERFVMCLGGVDPNATVALEGPTTPAIRRLMWASQETYDTWVASATNTAGDFELTTNGSLVCGRRTRGETLLWTTTDVWAAVYIGDVLIYSFQKRGDNCGIISTQAAAVIDTEAYWMGVDGFHYYNGVTRPLPCDVRDKVFNDFNRSQAWKVWNEVNPLYGEITWFYVSASGSEIDRYVTYNYREKHWVFGTMSRLCGVPPQAETGILSSPSNDQAWKPFRIDANGVIQIHEYGTTRAGSDFGTVYAESGPIEIGEGDQIMQVDRMLVDEKNLGDVRIYLYTNMYPLGQRTRILGPSCAFAYRPGDSVLGDASFTRATTAGFVQSDVFMSNNERGPFPVGNPTDLRAKARAIRVRWEEVRAVDWRIGNMRLDLKVASQR